MEEQREKTETETGRDKQTDGEKQRMIEEASERQSQSDNRIDRRDRKRENDRESK